MRDLLLRTLVALGVTALAVTEILGSFHLLTRSALVVTWAVFGAAVMVQLRKNRPQLQRPSISLLDGVTVFAICCILALTSITAALSPPNTFDALAYHMPRVVYWSQSQSVDFFPTTYLNQISFPPLAEYMTMHMYIITGNDRFANLIVWAAFAASIIGVSSVASALGATSRGQLFAAFFCATLPGAILQASGAKNDLLLAFWLICAVYFGLLGRTIFSGLSFGLAVATKGTAYLFGPALLAAMIGITWRKSGHPRRFAIASHALAAVLLLNAPQYWRNVQLSGSPLGFDSPFANGTFLLKNSEPGFKAMISNALRNVSDQVGARSQHWNQAVYDNVVRLHGLLNIDPNDPDTTWQWSRYGPPENTRHEANANNKWHLLLLCAALLVVTRGAWKHGDLAWLLYGCGVLAGFVAFCVVLRWQPYGARLLVPLFIAGAPLAGVLLARLRPQILALGVCVFLLDNARLPLLENWIRPLRGPRSIFQTSRESRYFADIRSMENEGSYVTAADVVARSGCRDVGIDISKNQLEYPFQALALERNPNIRFQHAGVENTSNRYRKQGTPQPCAVLCLDCQGDALKEQTYQEVGAAKTIGRFLLFIR